MRKQGVNTELGVNNYKGVNQIQGVVFSQFRILSCLLLVNSFHREKTYLMDCGIISFPAQQKWLLQEQSKVRSFYWLYQV